MGQQATENPEAKVFAYNFQNQNPRMEARGAITIVCDHCKFIGHKNNEFWFLHPYLRLKGPRRQSDQKQGDQSYREENKVFSVEKRGAK
jgi:hypothetical protein